MDRTAWQAFAEERILDASALLAARRWSAAYYLAGYAVEAGLKACILAYLASNPEVIFKRKTYSEKCWTHNIDELVKLAELETARKTDNLANIILGENWSKVSDWSELSRYDSATQIHAEELFNAITDVRNGVLPWIRVRW